MNGKQCSECGGYGTTIHTGKPVEPAYRECNNPDCGHVEEIEVSDE